MDKILKELYKAANNEYKNFNQTIMPDADKMLGVRMPILHKMAKEIYKSNDWQKFLEYKNYKFWEELMLQAMIIGEIKDIPENIIAHVKAFIPKINGWGVCDGFCSGLKFAKNNQKLVWDFIQPYFNSKQEYEKRFAFVMMLNYFVNEEYIDKCLDKFDKFRDERYYAKMAAAWALSICYIKFPQKTFEYLKISKLDDWTYNKGIQKICESLRVDKKSKINLKKYKRK